MPRRARIVVPGIPHHVIQRGNNRQDVFFVDGDRRAYLQFLREQAEKHELAVLGYCLMDNHMHVVATPAEATSLARAVGRTHLRYTQYINGLHGRSGHLWQNRFYSCALDEAHTVAAVRYVERNPVRAGLVVQAWEYEWSSARAHVGEADEAGVLEVEGWKKDWEPEQWREQLQGSEDAATQSRLGSNTARGWPLGSDSFLSKVERLLGRRVRPLPVGRPRKRKKPKK